MARLWDAVVAAIPDATRNEQTRIHDISEQLLRGGVSVVIVAESIKRYGWLMRCEVVPLDD
jgi:hypothetical protein